MADVLIDLLEIVVAVLFGFMFIGVCVDVGEIRKTLERKKGGLDDDN